MYPNANVYEESGYESGVNLDMYLKTVFSYFKFKRTRALTLGILLALMCQMKVALTFLLAALFALFAFMLAAELHNAKGKEDCQNPKADENAHRCRVHRAPCEWTRFN